MTTPDEIKLPKRRFLRLSLRGLILLVLILAVGLGWFVRRARVQREAVAAIERAGGRVEYHSEVDSSFWLNGRDKPSWWRWLADRVGSDHFDDVEFVELGDETTDAEMEQVGRLSQLVEIRGWRLKRVTDAGTAHLASLGKLKYLHLHHSSISGASLVNFRRMNRLEELLLPGIPISADQFSRLVDLERLWDLLIDGTNLDHSMLDQLARCRSLRCLSLSGPPLSDARLEEIRKALPGKTIYLWRNAPSQIVVKPENQPPQSPGTPP